MASHLVDIHVGTNLNTGYITTRTYPLHRATLAASSLVFRDILHKQPDTTYITLPSISPQTFELYGRLRHARDRESRARSIDIAAAYDLVNGYHLGFQLGDMQFSDMCIDELVRELNGYVPPTPRMVWMVYEELAGRWPMSKLRMLLVEFVASEGFLVDGTFPGGFGRDVEACVRAGERLPEFTRLRESLEDLNGEDGYRGLGRCRYHSHGDGGWCYRQGELD
jgi:hypothetical protein